MLPLQHIKVLLTTAGISKLKIDFDGELQIVNAEYVFRGVPGHKQITWEEIINSLKIGLPEATEYVKMPLDWAPEDEPE